MARQALGSGTFLRFAGALALFGFMGCTSPAPTPAEAPEPGWASNSPALRCSASGPIRIRAADVAIVIDASRSTREPGGTDVDEDGELGDHRYGVYTDPDDSLLEAQLVAVGRLVKIASHDGMRFSIVALTGRKDYPFEDSLTQRVHPHDSRLEAPLTDDVAALQNALERVRARGPNGASSFAPAMKLAVRSLSSADTNVLRPRRVLFLSDSWTPVRYAPSRAIARTDPRMKLEAQRALDAGVRFHTFAIGPAATEPPPHALAQIAGATGGTFRIVADPSALYCSLLASLQVVESTQGPRRFVEPGEPGAVHAAEGIGP